MNQMKPYYIKLIFPALLTVLILLSLFTAGAELKMHYTPVYPKENLLPLLEKTSWTARDYQLLLRQTGLGKASLLTLKANSPDWKEQILNFQKHFFAVPQMYCEKNSPISREEALIPSSSKPAVQTSLAPLENGDILLTASSHTFGWRNGHAAIVIDAKKGQTLESVVLGQDSSIQSVNKWKSYPTLLILRLREVPASKRNEIAGYAHRYLNQLPYNFMAGIFFSKKTDAAELKGTQCAHLVWAACYSQGYDIDSDGGLIVTPKDIALSPLLEVIQIYGLNPDTLWIS